MTNTPRLADENDQAPERILADMKDGSWFSRDVEDDKGAISDSDEVLYVRADLLATVRKEETEAAIDAIRACSTRDELHPDINITVCEFKERVIGLLKAALTEK